MPIRNSVFKRNGFFISEFYCPKCLETQTYAIRPMSEKVTFYQLAFFESGGAEHVVECQHCKKAFDPGILNRSIQRLLKLAGAAKCRFDQGISREEFKQQLLSDGLPESFVDQILSLAQHELD